jgi:hypothetical protein
VKQYQIDTIKECTVIIKTFTKLIWKQVKVTGDGCGGLMVDAWGGQAGIEWAQNKLEEINKTNMSKQIVPN